MPDPVSPLLTVPEMAQMLGLTRTEAYGWLEANLVPHQRRGSRYVIFRADVERLARQGTTPPDPRPPEDGARADWSALLAERRRSRSGAS